MKLIAEIEIQGLPKTINQIGQSHWRVKQRHTQKWKGLVIQHCYLAKISGLNLAKAWLTLTRCSAKEPDADNLAISFKPLVDGLVEAGVIIDDRPSVIGSSTYLWKASKMKAGKVLIRIEAA